jgi:hypothetical protein
MGTRSRIGVMHGDVCKSVYCHWDGYLEHNGRILLEHYDSAKANHLVALGDISSLDRMVEPPEGVAHSFQVPLDGVTTFYGRDRKEEGVSFVTDLTFESFLTTVEDSGAEFYYIMKDGEWYAGSVYETDGLVKDGLVLLAEALAAVDVEKAEA